MAEATKNRTTGETGQILPIDRLIDELRNLAEVLGERFLTSATEKVGDLTGRLTDYANKGGEGGLGLIGTVIGSKHPVAAGLKGVAKMAAGGLLKKITGGGGKGGKGKRFKFTTIVETLDVGAPLRVTYNQWTQFEDFPGFMKKVEGVTQESDEKLSWKAQIFWSHRTWESTIVEQIPDQRIIWRSKGPKGWVDGAVTFHALAPELTRVLLVLEYHPQGLFERTGNLWRAQGRRARLEFKHFRRHVMTQTLLHPDDVEGWRGEIRDSEIVKDHETALKEEQEEQERRERESPEEEFEEEREPVGEERGEEEPPEEAEEEEPGEPEEPEEPEEETGGEEEAESDGRSRARRRRRTVSAEEEPETEEEPEEEEAEEEPEAEEESRAERRAARRARRTTETKAEEGERPPRRSTRRRTPARSA
ncbi:SRPBCC family protein [Streptosporangium sp. NPDC051022]|uniref:SRPBCC family protein n=1 Tax=Streptosporangium sp. NPDC051022 TaxID=3155752 RepID=UPI00343FE506